MMRCGGRLGQIPNTNTLTAYCTPIQDGQVSSRVWRCGTLYVATSTAANTHTLTSNQPRRYDAMRSQSCRCWAGVQPWHCKLLCWIERELQRLENTILGCRTKRGESSSRVELVDFPTTHADRRGDKNFFFILVCVCVCG